MKLIDLAASNSQWTKQQIMQDPELVGDIQTRLGIAADRIWGGHTEHAVADFCKGTHLNNLETGVFGSSFAKALLEYEPNRCKISARGLDLICEFEGCRLQAYRCPAGVVTLGFGHTKGVKMGDRLPNIAAAKKLLQQDLDNEYIPGVLKSVRVPLTQNQLDALVSLCYNIGVGAIAKSTLVRKLNSGDIQGAANEFLKWDKAGGRTLPGLTRRRVAERQLFLS